MAKTIADLRRELEAKEAQLKELRARRRRIAGRLEVLDRRIAAESGRRPRRPRGKKAIALAPPTRAKGRQSLSDVLATVLRGKGSVKVAEAANLALAAGYRTSSSQFGNIVSQTLTSDKRFRKVARGVYALEAGKKAGPKTRAKRIAKKTAVIGKKAKSRQSLADILAEVAKGRKLLGIADAARLALEKGYKTKAKGFKLIVNKTLMRDKRFERVGRGIYTLRGQEGGIPDEMVVEPAQRKAKRKVTRKRVPRKVARPKKAAEKRVAVGKAARKARKAPAKREAAEAPGKGASLKALLAQVMAGRKAIGVREAMEAVLAAGYQTKAKDFRFIVNQTLYKNDDFRKVGRGRYTLRT